MTMITPVSIDFTVEKSEPELIAPSKPTPREMKQLSVLDEQKGLRHHVPSLYFYPHTVGMEGKDPVEIIKKAIARAFVYYYPLAGRLREGPNDTLVVDCNGEGVLFVEAKADVRLDQFGDVLLPPFPGMESLLCDIPRFNSTLHDPLALIQVTRLMCGGIVLSLSARHAMCDGTGGYQVVAAIAEIARGAPAPTVQPVWKRELLNPRNPPQVSGLHHAYDDLNDPKDMLNQEDMVHRSFFFSLQQLEILQTHVSPAFGTYTKFDILAAWLWQCRTVALQLNPNDEVRLAFFVNARGMLDPPLPAGYYGNVTGIPVALTTVGELLENPLVCAVKLIQRAKSDVTNEFMRSTIDFLVKEGRPRFTRARTYIMSNLTHMSFEGLDFGWGKPTFGGITGYGVPTSFFLPWKTNEGVKGIAVTANLPEPVMERFSLEVNKLNRRDYLVSSL